MPASNTSVFLQIVGTAVGSYFGPFGAYLGGLIGSVAGNLLDPNVAEGPRLGDLNVRASTYGKTIPLVYGRENRVGGNIIWTSGIQEAEHTQGSKALGSQVNVYTYHATFAIALGQGVMRNIEAIYGNGKLIWSKADTLERIQRYEAKQNGVLVRCVQLDNPTMCQNFQYSTPYLDAFDPANEMPDFTPWVLWPQVDLSSDGGGEVFDRKATLFAGGEFSALEWFPGTDDQPTALGIPAPTPAYRGTAYLVLHNLQLARFGNVIPTIEVVLSGLREETVAEIIDDMVDRSGAGITEVVARGALSQFFVRGYAVGNARNVVSAIRPLATAYPFDACDQEGVVRFSPRRHSPVVTIPEEDMGARPSGSQRQSVFPIERIPNYELPSEASITYIDPGNGYQNGTQIALRIEGDAQTKLNESLPITFTADEARAIAERLLWEGWLSREQIKPMSLSTKYDFLQPGDPFATTVPGGYAMYRILDLTRGDNGVIEVTALREDRTAYDGNSPGAEPFVYDQSPPSYEDIVPFLFNAPMMSPNEDNSGFSYALDTTGSSWSFGEVYRSTDETVTFDAAAHSDRRDRIAYHADVLNVGPSHIWDRVNELHVHMIYEGAVAPESVDEEVLLGNLGRNLIWVGPEDGSTGELIQFATAAQDNIGGGQASFPFDLGHAVNWARFNASVVPDAAIAPDGTMTADRVVENTALASHVVWKAGVFSGGTTPLVELELQPNTTYVLSGFVQQAGRGLAVLRGVDDWDNIFGHVYDLDDGSIAVDATTDGSLGESIFITVLERGIEDVGDGWWRLWIKLHNDVAFVNTLYYGLYPCAPATDMFDSIVYAGDGVSGIYHWGLRLAAESELKDFFVEGQYVLTNLLRGRRGTEHAIQTHGSDELVAFIPEGSLGSLDYGVSDWNLLRHYLALGPGQELGDPVLIHEFTGTGERLKPRSPVHVAGTRDGSNNLTLTWVRRDRAYTPPIGYGETPLSEVGEAYEVDIIVGGNVVRTISATTPTASYTAAQQTADGITPGNPVSGEVFQLSAVRGRGHELAFTV